MRDRSVELQVLTPGLVDYEPTWQWQGRLAQARAEGTGPDTILLLEHPSVYTAGKRTRPEDRPTDGIPVYDIDRGGRITWHGPGQLVGYPIIGLQNRLDGVGYIRLLEQVLMAVCDELGVPETGRVEGRSGVWVPAAAGQPERKIAAIGVRVAKGVTKHGFALNCDNTLDAYHAIVPCGITDAGVTTLSLELGRLVTVAEVLPLVQRLLVAGLNGELPVVDRPLHRPEPVSAGLRWELDPALR